MFNINCWNFLAVTVNYLLFSNCDLQLKPLLWDHSFYYSWIYPSLPKNITEAKVEIWFKRNNSWHIKIGLSYVFAGEREREWGL